ncbi:MAG: phosphate ABC transporter permease subunit PstC [Microscillaceae bacterium]
MARTRIGEKLIEGFIYLSGTTTTLVVLLIVLFLFKEGLGLFATTPLEEGYVLAIHPQNPLKTLDEASIKKVFNKEVSDWAALGWKEGGKIKPFLPSNIEKTFEAQALGQDFENLKPLMTAYFEANPALLVAMPGRYVDEKFPKLKLDNISLGDFLGGEDWFPTSQPIHSFGILPIILGTVWICVGALLLAIPMGVIAAIYLAEIARPAIRSLIMPFIELLAGIPSVIYGFFGLVVIVPIIQQTFNLAVGETALAGSILLGIIALPTIITIGIDAIQSVPRELKEASLALGANHWQTIYKVVLPYAISGIVSAAILGVGRTVGETMAVLMVTGNAAQIPNSFLMPVRAITATVAAELGEAPQGGIHYKALFMLACILFVFTFFMNLLAEWVVSKRERK